MIRRPPTSTRPDTRFPYATLFRSAVIAAGGLSRQADGNGATVLRRSEVGYQEIPVRLVDLVRDGDSTANIPLLPGDVIIIPEGFFQGEWHVVYGASASQTISDNIDQDPDGERDVGFITRAGDRKRVG